MNLTDPTTAKEKLGEDIADIFLKHAEELSIDATAELMLEVNSYLERIEQELTANAVIDLEAATKVSEACKRLLENYRSFPEPTRAAVVGAVRYFLDTADAEDDLSSFDGLEDDVQVINYVIINADMSSFGIAPISLG